MARKVSGSHVKNEGQNVGGGEEEGKEWEGKAFFLNKKKNQKPNIDNEQTHEK